MLVQVERPAKEFGREQIGSTAFVFEHESFPVYQGGDVPTFIPGGFRMIERLLRGIGGALGVRIAVRILRDVAEGKRGPAPQRAYLFLIGKKRVTAALLGLVAAVTAGAGYPEEALLVGTIGGVLYSLGFLDKAWRDHPPVFVELREYALYRVLADNAATVTTVLATLWAYVQAGHCGGYDCDLVAKILLGAGTGLAYLGVADAAWKSRPPALTPTRR